jgi:hypothetical protein
VNHFEHENIENHRSGFHLTTFELDSLKYIDSIWRNLKRLPVKLVSSFIVGQNFTSLT